MGTAAVVFSLNSTALVVGFVRLALGALSLLIDCAGAAVAVVLRGEGR